MSESEIPTKVPRCHPAAHIWCCCKAACLCTSKGCSNPVQSCPVQPRKISPHFGVIFATTLPKPLFFFSEIPREKGKKNTKNHGEQTGRHPQSSRVFPGASGSSTGLKSLMGRHSLKDPQVLGLDRGLGPRTRTTEATGDRPKA